MTFKKLCPRCKKKCSFAKRTCPNCHIDMLKFQLSIETGEFIK